mmetsp:Transcript_14157/g.32873  ORF Transcript_14157/g.32873 Transcript_14157/m.32873 type:complete len:349 (+) Transcript_14157:641-1687(+)
MVYCGMFPLGWRQRQHDVIHIGGSARILFVCGEKNIIQEPVRNEFLLVFPVTFITVVSNKNAFIPTICGREIFVQLFELCLALVILIQITLLQRDSCVCLVHIHCQITLDSLDGTILSNGFELAAEPQVITTFPTTAEIGAAVGHRLHFPVVVGHRPPCLWCLHPLSQDRRHITGLVFGQEYGATGTVIFPLEIPQVFLKNPQRPHQFGPRRRGEPQIVLFQSGRRALDGHLLKVCLAERDVVTSDGALTHISVVVAAAAAAAINALADSYIGAGGLPNPTATRKTTGALRHCLFRIVQAVVVHAARSCRGERIRILPLVLLGLFFAAIGIPRTRAAACGSRAVVPSD